MPYKITADCIGCASCVEACVAGAIHPQGDVYIINEEQCTHCGECEDVCPVNAIVDE